MRIGEIIKKSRTARNITQEEMAVALHITPQAISRWENGLSYPDVPMLPLIAKFLNISTDRLLGCTDLEYRDSREILNQIQIDSIFDYVPCQKAGCKKVLVVDDAAFMRDMLKDILSSEGHYVTLAQNGLECLEILEKELIDICILDINMPVMNGMQALEMIRERYPQIKVIILSVQCTVETVEKALSLGADSFVAKPFAPNSILERVGRFNSPPPKSS